MFLVELPLARSAAGNGLGENIQIVRGKFLHVFMIGARQRMQLDLAVAVLTLTAGLLDVFAFGNGLLANGFAIGDLRTADIGLHVIFAQHAVNDDFQVQFAHAGDQCLAGIRLGGNAERGIFLRQALHSDAELVLVRLGFRLDSDGNNRRGKLDGFQNDGLVFVAQRVAGVDILQSDARANIARANFVNFLALVGMHLQQAARCVRGNPSQRSTRSFRISERRNKRGCK